MTRVPVQTTPTFSAGTATALFEKRCFSGAAEAWARSGTGHAPLTILADACAADPEPQGDACGVQ